MNPTEEQLHSPYLLKNIEVARDMIVDSIKKSEKISIFSDPDNDGTNSTAIMYNYLKTKTNNVTYFSSERESGHGISTSLDKIPLDTKLLILVDSSSNESKECELIQSKGIKVIILDHHQISNPNPFCILVNPQSSICLYPNKNISGSVVTWKMCRVLDDYYKTNYSETQYDLMAIGLIGDVMSLLEPENRFIVHMGMKRIRNVGIKYLLEELKIEESKLTPTSVSYSISPCINAACRLNEISTILNLLTETSIPKAKQLAVDVVKMNEERKRVQKELYDKLIHYISNKDKCSIIINNEIGSGYRGLVAGVFCEEFQKPIMILSKNEDDTYSGSYRFYGNTDFKTLLNNIPEVIYAEGHPTVGGIKFKCDDLDKVNNYLNQVLTNNHDEQFLEYLIEFDVDDLNGNMIKKIEEFYKISGKDFPTGVFLIKNLRPQSKTILGKDKNTLKIPCIQMSETYFKDDKDIEKMKPSMTLMKFRTSDEYFSDEYIGKEIEVIGELNSNEWLNPRTKKVTKTNQLFINDFRLVD